MYSRENVITVPSTWGATGRVINIALFAVFTALAAQIAVRLPFTPVPVTVQTVFVIMAGMLLGPRDGFYAMCWYLILGVCGAPVFAGFAFGPAVLMGPTGGYLLAFPAAALLSGYLFSMPGEVRWSAFFGAAAGSTVILAGGALYLGMVLQLSLPEAIMLAVAPFAGVELIKAFLAAAVIMKWK